MNEGYVIDPLDNLPDGYGGRCRSAREIVCPVCGCAATVFYVFRPPGRKASGRVPSEGQYTVGCDRCVFTVDAT